MGIKGIKTLIKKHVPDAISEINLESLRNTTICIDSSILLYKFRYTYNSDNFHILGFLHKTIELLKNGITPIYVFDGKPPDAKKEILIKRKEQNIKLKEQLDKLKEEISSFNPEEFIDSDSEEPDENVKNYKIINQKITNLEKNIKNVSKTHSLEVIELLKSIGVSFFESPSEAEEACVFLQTNGYADYILTEDTDSLTFGGTKILFNKKNSYSLCCLDKVLNGLQLNHDEFIDLCILCGCDYTCTIPKVGPVTALQIIKKHRSIENFLKTQHNYKVPESFNYATAQHLFKKKDTKFVDFSNEFNKVKFLEILSKWNLNYLQFNFFEKKDKFQFI